MSSEMYPSSSERVVIDAAEKLMVETMARYDPSHDAYHVQRVRKTALALARALPTTPDLLVVEIAALLHDVLDKKYVSAAEASDPYSFFLPFFTSAAQNGGPDLVSDGRARLITRVIENVSWTTEKALRARGAWGAWHDECSELHCVQDADRLDAIGAFDLPSFLPSESNIIEVLLSPSCSMLRDRRRITHLPPSSPIHPDLTPYTAIHTNAPPTGILRCAAFSCVSNRPLHTPPADPRQPESALQHFHDKLVHIRGRLKTVPGRQMGEKRHQVVRSFICPPL
ncbi:hypothetical protein D9611_001818 [Ephemerocybe angulata]|uniref:HD/PDEase domain-containing protein n=1 Tax=Ephemerocybe angulata TaxID=980116 RepID=A0A8H5CHB6_9AGAR|nr:hypothetical protein D9611_001818 [Tulosesus angulatus]